MLTLINALQLKKQEGILLPNFTFSLNRSDYPWSEVKGMDEIVETLENHIIRPVREYNHSKTKILPVKTVIFYGLQGGGKTFVAKSLAAELKRVYWDSQWLRLETFLINSSDLTAVSVDETKSRISRLFRRVVEHKPSILIMDDLDKLFKCRLHPHHHPHEKNVGANHHHFDYDSMVTDHLLTCIDQLKDSGGGRERKEPAVHFIGITNTYHRLTNTNLFDSHRFDMNVPFYALDPGGRQSFLEKLGTHFSPAGLQLVVQDTRGFNPADLIKLQNCAVIIAASRSRGGSIRKNNKSNPRSSKKLPLLQEEDWIRALVTCPNPAHYHHHQHAGTCFRTLTVWDDITPLVCGNVMAISTILQSKLMFPAVTSSHNNNNNNNSPIMSSSTSTSFLPAVHLFHVEIDHFRGISGSGSNNNNVLYLWHPKSGKMSLDFVNKYLVPSILLQFPQMPTFVISEDSYVVSSFSSSSSSSSQEYSVANILRMIQEARNYLRPCFLIIQSLGSMSTRLNKMGGGGGDMMKIVMREVAQNPPHVFTIATSQTDSDKLTACLQQAFHGYQNSYKIQSTSEEQVRAFISQAFDLFEKNEGGRGGDNNNDFASSSSLWNNNNNGHKEMKESSSTIHQQIKCQFVKNNKMEDGREDKINFDFHHHHDMGSTNHHDDDDDDRGPSNKIPRLDADSILERAIAVTTKMSMQTIIWFYQDLVRMKRQPSDGDGCDPRKILMYQDKIVEDAEEIHKMSSLILGRRSSKNNISVTSTNNISNSDHSETNVTTTDEEEESSTIINY